MDYAYLLDVKMPLADGKAYAVRALENRSPLVRYAYAMRLMRKDRLDEAELIFADLGNKRLELARPGSNAFAWLADASRPEIDNLYDPLITTRDIRAMRKTIEGARGEAKPEAMYALASYYYTRRNLLLYNASLWDGMRNSAMSIFFSDKTNDATDRKVRLEHAYEHESLARSRAICLQIIKEFPGVTLDRQGALSRGYRRASLGRLQPSVAQYFSLPKLHWKQAADHLNELATRFPNDPLAANARKYAKVFQEEAGDEWKSVAPSAKGKDLVLE